MPNKHPESEIQQAIVKHLIGLGHFPMAIPNGAKLAGTAKQRAMRAAILKREGMVPGAPDLIVWSRNGRVGTIEVKPEGGYARRTQKDVQERLEKLGHHYAICRSIPDVDETLEEWGW